MMNFMRRLALPREGDRSRAVAVLPSRFAGVTPLRSAPAPGEAPSIFDEVSAPSLERSRLPDTHTAPQAFAGPALPDGAISARAPDYAPDALPRESAPAALRRLRAVDVAAAVPAGPSTRAAVVRDARALPARVHAAAVAPVSMEARPDSANAIVASTAAGPLSQGTMAAARSNPAAPPPPVIHVTIDRIDVRAPAAPLRADQPTKARNAAPSLSLSDYLRGSASKQRGGAA